MQSEDCLVLNVFTPGLGAARKRPVMVWIHGGGYTNGATAMPLYRGDRLARRGYDEVRPGTRVTTDAAAKQ